MNDIVERLRAAMHSESAFDAFEAMRLAKEEIERLRADAKIAKVLPEVGYVNDLRAEIERLQAREFGERPPNMQCADLIIRDLKADNERLRAALRTAACPGGGFNGMPKDADATVGLCVDHKVCGCDLGRALV